MPKDTLSAFDKFMCCVWYYTLDQMGFSALKDAYPGQAGNEDVFTRLKWVADLSDWERMGCR